MSRHSSTIISLASVDPRLQQHLSKELGISRLTAQILINRGVSDPGQAAAFLRPQISQLHDPFAFLRMDEAVRRIRQAVASGEQMLIYGDYDVDGITALALLKKTITGLGGRVSHYIPHRVKEGYGLNVEGIRQAVQRRCRLFLTVDCGTNSQEHIRALNAEGIDVIITDHHEVLAGADHSGCILLNPKHPDSGYPFRELAGVGVAFKLCQALSGQSLAEDLDLVCLGTIADAVPLLSENRVFAAAGLPKIFSSAKPGVRALIESSRLASKRMKPDHVSFVLAPRINASGRMDTAEHALQLLMSQDRQGAAELARQLEECNRRRQKVESQILQEAEALISREVNFAHHSIMVLAKEGWHLGVLGVVASKLADRFSRPTILISVDERGCRGSGRSAGDFHLFREISRCQELLCGFGGHQHAVGMVLKRDNIDAFRAKINLLAKESLQHKEAVSSVQADLEVNLSQLDEKLVRELELLEPFGVGNPRPLLLSRQVRLKGEPRVLGKETLKFWVTDGSATFPAIGFGMAGCKAGLTAQSRFDLVFFPKIDSWMDEESVILEVEEIKPC